MKNAKDLRKLSSAELGTMLLDQKREQFNLRMARAQGQLTQTHEMRNARRTLARIKTIIGEKTRASQ